VVFWLYGVNFWQELTVKPLSYVRGRKGKVVPRVLNRFSKRRKISIEVHKVTPLTKDVDDKGNFIAAAPYEECVIR
jgi:hypothetical protein